LDGAPSKVDWPPRLFDFGPDGGNQIRIDHLTSTFQWQEEAYQQRVFRIIELTLPMFDNLRLGVRWEDLVRRIGLPA
jgi:hypothetical protein